MIIVTGAKGMLGKRVVQEAEKTGKRVLVLGHGELNIADGWQVMNWAQSWTEEDILINCAGIPGDIAPPVDMVSANTLGPHMLNLAAEKYGFHLVHVSTDCVFSGHDRSISPRMRDIHEAPNPDSFYGRTKLAGEPSGANVTVVRTSFVGPEHGLMKWVLEQESGAAVEGWRNAWWSGSTVGAVARALVKGPHRKRKTEHLCTIEPITKLQAIHYIADAYGRKLNVLSGGPRIDRSMATTWMLPSLAAALLEDAENDD